ncbi:MAG: hypothetical protein JSU77_11315 [Fidelibacterota bacterium]|nr:MAG: hypothetical protein JSU77_11315 [Candidatus Neomarinimicrobiota bacterium]
MLWYGCDGTGIEPSDELPVLSSPQTSYDDRDDSIYVAVTVTFPENVTALDSIWTEMYLASGDLADSLGTDSLWKQVTLNDDAVSGDILPQDGVYARKFDSPLPKGTGGSLRFEFYAFIAGDTSSTSDILRLVNLRPAIVSVVLTKDTFTRPDSGYVVVDTIYATAVDPDSLEDLRGVTFQIVKPDSTLGVGLEGNTSFPLYDDGSRIDAEASDGIYSGGVTFGFNNPVGTYILKFIARDLSGAVSDTVSRSVVVQ